MLLKIISDKFIPFFAGHAARYWKKEKAQRENKRHPNVYCRDAKVFSGFSNY
jgi:hypothetical protein